MVAEQVINPHVELLNAYQPFDSDFSGIFFESSNLVLDLRTVASDSLRLAVDERDCQVVILTGDAGHGKTHLCGQLLADLIGEPLNPALARRLADNGRGDGDLATCASGRALRIIKDLSEFSREAGAEALRNAVESADHVTVVCANEGRLRSAAEHAHLTALIDALNSSILAGQTKSPDGRITILNLNHQSVASTTRAGNIFRQLIAHWVDAPEVWSPCDSCIAREHCPVLANRMSLAENVDDGPVGGLELLLRTAERTGHVVTIRELLIFVAHVVTGGLRCGDVHRLTNEFGSSNWQWQFVFHEVAFGDRVPVSVRRELDVFAGVSKLDPGRRALRAVDSRLDPTIGPRFDPPFRPNHQSLPTTRAAKLKETREQARMWQYLRRHDFFRCVRPGPGMNVPAAEDRLGLRHLRDFEAVVGGDISTEVRNQLLRGLEAVQGVHRNGTHSFVLVDPALTGAGGDAVIIADTVALRRVRLMSEREAWKERAASATRPDVHEHVDWIDRRIIVSFDGSAAPVHKSIALSLHEFEFVLRTVSGLRSTSFFAPEMRRFKSRLASMVDVDGFSDTMSFIADDRQRTLMIDGGRLVEVDG